MSDTDGGPAFPAVISGETWPGDYAGSQCHSYNSAGGMTLRDYFAGQALGAMVACFLQSGDAWNGYDDLSQSVYRVADAMLKARETP